MQNEHFTVQQLSKLISNQMAVMEERLGRPLVLKTLGHQKTGEDATTKILDGVQSGQKKSD